MPRRNTLVRTLHDLGLAAWFGGSLMGAVGLNGAAEEVGGRTRTAKVASAGWAKWAPVNAVAIGAHLVGAAGIAMANRDRVRKQKGVLASTVAKTVFTGLALAATAYSRVLGKKIEMASSSDSTTTERAEELPIPVEQAQQQLRYLQWSIPVLTGAMELLNALHGEQQRPDEQWRGRLEKARARLAASV
ncbi:MAG TPA: hypothetical protein VIL00_04395 [Pseudonocardiaceae bacterium]